MAVISGELGRARTAAGGCGGASRHGAYGNEHEKEQDGDEHQYPPRHRGGVRGEEGTRAGGGQSMKRFESLDTDLRRQCLGNHNLAEP